GNDGGCRGHYGTSAGVGEMGGGEIESAIHLLAGAADQGGCGRVRAVLVKQDALPGSNAGGSETHSGAAGHVHATALDINRDVASSHGGLRAQIDSAIDIVYSRVQRKRLMGTQVDSVVIVPRSDGRAALRTQANSRVAEDGGGNEIG